MRASVGLPELADTGRFAAAACHNKVSTGRQGFQGQVCYSRFATARFPGAGLLQQVCNNKVSRGRFDYSRCATTRFPRAGLLQQACHDKVSTGRFATAGLQQQGFYG